ncbi:MAG: TetR/AcrR family transcriptional regulator [Fretibacterium sp.]|nr:TetR/AcrR family transcriptional regulator [Fretibacterium sp.]
MKRKTAKEILAASFVELAAKKSVDKITIQEIVDNCGYSPATFYRNFRDKYDLITWVHTRGVAGIMGRMDTNSYDKWKQTLREAANWFYNEKEYLINLLRHTDGYDSFMRHMVEIHYSALKKYILSVNGNHELDTKEKMLVRAFCLGAVGLVCEWILGQYRVTPEEIAGVCEEALPEPLKKHLLQTRENGFNLS